MDVEQIASFPTRAGIANLPRQPHEVTIPNLKPSDGGLDALPKQPHEVTMPELSPATGGLDGLPKQPHEVVQPFANASDQGPRHPDAPGVGYGSMIPDILGSFIRPDGQGSPAIQGPLDLAQEGAKRQEPKKTDYEFGTFNVYGDKGYDKQSDLDILGDFAAGKASEGQKPLDVVGFQEADNQKAAAQIAGEMAQNGMNGYMSDGGNPIYWNASKFDLVHQETLVIHDKNQLPSGEGTPSDIDKDKKSDQRRTTSFVVLKDKETGAEILVTNRHQDHNPPDKDHTRNREAHINKTNIKADELKEKFPGISARVDLGDFNQYDPGKSGPTYKGNEQYDTRTKTDAIDHILSEGQDFPTTSKPEVLTPFGEDGFHGDEDGGHSLMSQTISVTSSERERAHAKGDNATAENGAGAVFYQNSNYGGDAWAFGFGRENGPKHSEWNDRTSSIAVTPDKGLTAYKDAHEDGQQGLKVDTSTPNVGKDWNDKISAFDW
ncbi:MAG: hypothetical protein DI498_01610 [Paracoccus denitrificans]|nr:MAG: hypothetical protein DI498_01610 [Paracoccus denitrificans]PZO85862.1 MAG: hypothetical protein DI633_01610 [Paracoccus denitrificans]